MLSKIVSSCSLIFCLCALCFGMDYQLLARNFDAAKTAEQKIHVLENFADANPNLSTDDPTLFEQIVNAEDNPASFKADKISQMLSLRVSVNKPVEAPPDTVTKIKSIKSSPLYSDSGNQSGQNWLRKALERLFPKNAPAPEVTPRTLSLASAGGNIFIYICIAFLVAAIIFFLVLAIRHFSWQKKLKRKSSALLEEDEPERSADEWLKLADGLSLQGRYREAVRCLYLACLLRIDEANVARFVRSETNWEHLARIQGSPKRPPDLDLLPPTRSFDEIWYGHQVRGIPDVDQFKIWYEEVIKTLRAEAA